MSRLPSAAAVIELPSFGLRAEGFQFRDDVTAQAVQLAHGQHDFAAQKILQRAQQEGSKLSTFGVGTNNRLCFEKSRKEFLG